jgi:hypothetical protein
MDVCAACGARLSRYAGAGATLCATHEQAAPASRDRPDAAQALLRWRWHREIPPPNAGATLGHGPDRP